MKIEGSLLVVLRREWMAIYILERGPPISLTVPLRSNGLVLSFNPVKISEIVLPTRILHYSISLLQIEVKTNCEGGRGGFVWGVLCRCLVGLCLMSVGPFQGTWRRHKKTSL